MYYVKCNESGIYFNLDIKIINFLSFSLFYNLIILGFLFGKYLLNSKIILLYCK